MSKAVLISILPKWCELIASGKKTIEVRKTAPKIDTPFKCYIYCTNSGRPLVYGDKPCADGWTEAYTQTYGYSREEADKIWGVMNGKVIGEFVCDKIYGITPDENGWGEEYGYSEHDCLSDSEMLAYLGCSGRGGFGWHISDLVIYDVPKQLKEFEVFRTEHVTRKAYFQEGVCDEIVHVRMLVPLERPPQSWCYVVELT